MPSANRFALLRDTVRNHPVIGFDDRGHGRRLAGRVCRGPTAGARRKPPADRNGARCGRNQRRQPVDEIKPAPKPSPKPPAPRRPAKAWLRPIASSRPGPICRGLAWRSIAARIAARAWSRPTSSTSRRSPRSRRSRRAAAAALRRPGSGHRAAGCFAVAAGAAPSRHRAAACPAGGRQRRAAPACTCRRSVMPAPAASRTGRRTTQPGRSRQPAQTEATARAKRRKSASPRRPSENRKRTQSVRRSRTWMTTAIRSPAPIPTIALPMTALRRERSPDARRAASSSAGPSATTTCRIPGARTAPCHRDPARAAAGCLKVCSEN